MKKFILLCITPLLFIACKKQHDNNCLPEPAETEANNIAAYCNANGIAYTVDTNGIYYQVVDPGTGAKPNVNSKITVTYSTDLLTGEIIDTTHLTNPVSQPLSQFIEGWRIAIPYIQQGGHIKMVIPSSLAYGCTGIKNLVPPNAPLFYDVILVGVTN